MYMTEMYKLQFGFDMFTYVCVCATLKQQNETRRNSLIIHHLFIFNSCFRSQMIHHDDTS